MIFYWVTSKILWVPLYLLLFYLTYLKFKWRVFTVGIFIGLLFLIGDQTSVKLFKDVFERLRPCHNSEITNMVHIINGHCGGQYGFVSSHATNSFALTVFIGFLLKKHYRFMFPMMLFWAALVSYSRIYVGVHFPADILGGAVLGSAVGFLVYGLMKLLNNKFNLKLVEL